MPANYENIYPQHGTQWHGGNPYFAKFDACPRAPVSITPVDAHPVPLEGLIGMFLLWENQAISITLDMIVTQTEPILTQLQTLTL